MRRQAPGRLEKQELAPPGGEVVLYLLHHADYRACHCGTEWPSRCILPVLASHDTTTLLDGAKAVSMRYCTIISCRGPVQMSSHHIADQGQGLPAELLKQAAIDQA